MEWIPNIDLCKVYEERCWYFGTFLQDVPVQVLTSILRTKHMVGHRMKWGEYGTISYLFWLKIIKVTLTLT